MTSRKTDIFNVMLAIVAYHEGMLYPCGTGFLVGRGLAMTAAHVLLAPPIGGRTFRVSNDEEVHPLAMSAFQVIGRGGDPLQWQIKEAYLYPSLSDDLTPIDAAFVRLEPIGPNRGANEQFRWWWPELNLVPPHVGEEVTSYGFVNSRIERQKDESFDCRHASRSSSGLVQQLHTHFRDRSGMAFPCFETSANFEAGMSGGPVFNGREQVCGIVSRGMTDGSVSWASMLWPAMGIRVGGRLARDLVREGEIRARGRRTVYFDDETKEFPSVFFDPSRA